jgi:DNA-binding winged helix-turn-helix (wHTH) protein/tetratricopeptide (TPR) repeat protein
MSLENSPSFFSIFSGVESDTKRSTIYTFRSFRLDVAERRLTDSDTTVALTPKAFDVLVYLVERGGRLVEKEELLENVWSDSIVEESNLAKVVFMLRRVLGESKDGDRFIETVPKKGYRFVADVEKVEDEVVERPTAETAGVSTPANPEKNPRLYLPIVRTQFPRIAVICVTVALLIALATWFWGATEGQGSRPFLRALNPETLSGEAHQQYSQGRFFVERRHRGDYEKALEHFERAIELDPNYANALAGKADVKVVQFWGSSSHEDIAQARRSVRKAIEIDPQNSYARTVLCRILTTYDWDHSAAEKECRTAVELDPNDHEAQKELAFLLSSLGKEDEALSAIEGAVAIAPTSFNKRSRGLILYHARRYDEAIEQLRQVEQTDPAYRETARWMIRSYQMKGDHENALNHYLRLLEHSGSPAEELVSVRAGLERDGWNSVLRHMTGNNNFRTMFLAGTYAQLGDKDKAFEVLEEMYDRKAILLITLKREPSLDPIRDDPRFSELVRKVGLN